MYICYRPGSLHLIFFLECRFSATVPVDTQEYVFVYLCVHTCVYEFAAVFFRSIWSEGRDKSQ